jgi:hypothetical protein
MTPPTIKFSNICGALTLVLGRGKAGCNIGYKIRQTMMTFGDLKMMMK